MCFAYWEAMPEGQKERLEEFTDTISLVFCGCPFDRELLKSGTYSIRMRLVGCPVVDFARQHERMR